MDEQLWLDLALVILRHRYENGLELEEIEVVLEQLLLAVAEQETVGVPGPFHC
jgi:hypothetical protein